MKRKILFSLALIILLALSTYTYARQIGEFSDFKITRNGEKTGYLLKIGNTGSNYILNLYPCRELSPMKVKHFLVNIQDNRRSDVHLLTCGERWNFSNWASQNYSYSLRMSRENWWDGPAYITGSWFTRPIIL